MLPVINNGLHNSFSISKLLLKISTVLEFINGRHSLLNLANVFVTGPDYSTSSEKRWIWQSFLKKSRQNFSFSNLNKAKERTLLRKVTLQLSRGMWMPLEVDEIKVKIEEKKLEKGDSMDEVRGG